MRCLPVSPRLFLVCALLLSGLIFSWVPLKAAPAEEKKAAKAAATKEMISGQDANGRSVTVNGSGHYTVVLYTNPDLESTARKITVGLDSFRSRSDFTFVRVVDLRGGIPPDMRGIVNNQIRQEQAKEDLRLKKAGVDVADSKAPIIPDFSGTTLNALGWDSIYDDIHLVVYDRNGREVKRLEKVTTAKELTHAVDSVL